MRLFKFNLKKHIGLYLLLIFITVLQSPVKAEFHESKKVLLINSYHKGYLWTDEITRGIEDTFKGKNIDLSIEYMDTKHQFDDKYVSLLHELFVYKQKYNNDDVVIVSDNNALDFALNFRDEIFGEIPIVFCGINNLRSGEFEGIKNITGVNQESDVRNNIKLIRFLHPSCERILLISDNTTTGKRIQTEYKAIEEDPEFSGNKIDLIYNLSIEALHDTLANLNWQTIPLLSVFFRDSDNKVFEYNEFTSYLTKTTPVPVYGLMDYNLNHGIVGGKLVTGYQQGANAAEKVIEILNGKKADDIPIQYETPTEYMFDYNVLKKYKLNNLKLPENSIIINKPVSVYEQYKIIIWDIIAVFIMLLLILIATMYAFIKTRESKKAVIKSRESLKATLESIGDAVIATDTDGQIIIMNYVAEELTGWNIEEAIGLPLESVFKIFNSQTKEEIGNPVKAVLKNEKAIAGLPNHTVLQSKTGKEYEISDSAAPIKNDEGVVTGVVLVFRDITNLKAMEAQIIQTQKMESIGQLAGGIAHDFNNLLSPIIGNAELALFEVDNNSQISEFLNEISETALRASELTRQLLAFSRQQVLDIKALDVNMLINNFKSILLRTLREDIKVKFDLGENLWMIKADKPQIEQILMNLIVNARDALSTGGLISVKTENEVYDEYFTESHVEVRPGKYVMISINDTGSGMDEETLENIFDPFFTTKEIGKGTGLGLSTVHGIVKQHGGHIWVYSEIGKGTSFKIIFPAIEEVIKTEEDTIVDKNEYIGNGKVLVVEDQENVLLVARRILQRYGYDVTTAMNAEEAMQKIEENQRKFDLLLTDIIMPGKNGRELYEEAIKMIPELKVIYMSGYAKDIISHHNILGKEISFIQKPLTIDSLMKVVNESMKST